MSGNRRSLVALVVALALVAAVCAIAGEKQATASHTPRYDVKAEHVVKATVAGIRTHESVLGYQDLQRGLTTTVGEMEVHLGPVSSLARRGIELKPGDEFVVTGCKTTWKDHPVIVARNLKAADTELREWSHTLEDRVKEKTAELEQIHQQIMLVEKTASMGKMAASVAHELNNPLSGIITYAKLSARRLRSLLPDGPEKRQVLEHLELIGSESMRCGNIVRDLLTYARASRAEFRTAHLHDLVARALKLVEHHTALREVQATSDLQLADDEVVCDADQIVQALVALLINAVEAMPDGGQLTVRTWAPSDDATGRACFSVSDTGVGIPDSVRDRIFDPFFSTKTETKGVGLGLAVVYGIVQRHEGEITVTSAVGKGTTFIITIPRDPERVVRARAQWAGAEAASS